MTTDTPGTEERGELEDVFSGGPSSPDDDPFAFLRLPSGTASPPPAPAASAHPMPAIPEPAAEVEVEVLPPEPAADAPKSVRLAYFETIVDRERERFRQSLEAADKRFVESASGPLFAINREKLYLEMVSAETGKPFERFRDYLQERWSISRAHGYRILNEFPVQQALGDLAPEKLTTRQVPKLLAVLRSRGADDPTAGAEAVRTVWRESDEKSPAALQATIDRLGWGDPAAAALDDLSDSERERVALVDRWSKAAQALDPHKARELLARNPEGAQRLLEQLKPFVEALEEVAQIPGTRKS
ncbi:MULTISPECIES: hypothetical protein [unclassified Streptomyces]|uniref:hypothetical protein n=1 Tax=unclassified Streptomyces TaxID=2593676 RepID=UPI00331C10C2